MTGTVMWQRLHRPPVEILQCTDDRGTVFRGEVVGDLNAFPGRVRYRVRVGADPITETAHASIYGPMRATATVISSEAARESGRLTAWRALTLRTPERWISDHAGGPSRCRFADSAWPWRNRAN